ncbi:MAG: hypothetical protein GC183_04220 [Thiobacillus sp.]|nr:hypothetical protein [Thiobacillus sp.]
MKLLELTPAEIAFLSWPPSVPADLPARLTRRLGAMLTARLHRPVQVQVQSGLALADSLLKPCWQPDPALATLWLTRRLGGKRVAGVASFVPCSLIQNLDGLLAECWLDAASPATFPLALAWCIEADPTQAMLSVQLPRNSNDMTRWAREVIRHG